MDDLYVLFDDKGLIKNPNDKKGLFTLDEAKGFMSMFEPNGSFVLLPIKLLKRKRKNAQKRRNK